MELEEIIERLEAVEDMNSELEAILAKWFVENTHKSFHSTFFGAANPEYLREPIAPDGWEVAVILFSENKATVVLGNPNDRENAQSTARTMAHAMRIACMKAHKIERDAKQKTEKGFVGWEWFENFPDVNTFRVCPVNKAEPHQGFRLDNLGDTKALCDLLNRNEVPYD